MDRFEAIFKRKSVRKYSKKKLSRSLLGEIKEKINNINKLHENIDSKIILAEDGERVQKTFSGLKSKIARVDSPHYLIGVSEEKKGYLENIGYMVEEAVLNLTKREIGSCWLGSGIEHDLLKDIFEFNGNTVILVAFGNSVLEKDNLRDDPQSASRKDLEDLVINKSKNIPKEVRKILDAARMAPSALNSQPWRFFYESDVIHIYLEKKGVFKKMVRKIGDLEKLNHIDVGIALKHLEIGADKFSNNIKFEDQRKKKRGYEYIISVILD